MFVDLASMIVLYTYSLCVDFMNSPQVQGAYIGPVPDLTVIQGGLPFLIETARTSFMDFASYMSSTCTPDISQFVLNGDCESTLACMLGVTP